jgi:hypothetical protein
MRTPTQLAEAGMPRTYAFIAILCAFAIGLITGSVGVYLSSDYRQVQQENEQLKRMNQLQKKQLDDINSVLLHPQPPDEKPRP